MTRIARLLQALPSLMRVIPIHRSLPFNNFTLTCLVRVSTVTIMTRAPEWTFGVSAIGVDGASIFILTLVHLFQKSRMCWKEVYSIEHFFRVYLGSSKHE